MSKNFTYTILISCSLSLSQHSSLFLSFSVSVSVFFLPVPLFIVVKMQSVCECIWFFYQYENVVLVVLASTNDNNNSSNQLHFERFASRRVDVLKDEFRYLWYNDLLASNSRKSYKYESISVDIHIHMHRGIESYGKENGKPKHLQSNYEMSFISLNWNRWMLRIATFDLHDSLKPILVQFVLFISSPYSEEE